MTSPTHCPSLKEKRLLAARASGGTSSDRIHDCAIAALGQLSKGQHLLEFGAGTGVLLQRIADEHPDLTAVGVDLYPRPNSLPEHLEWLQADLNDSIPLPDASFDVIISTEVIEHLENPRAMAREFSRLLKPGGKIVVTTPNQESLRSLISLIVSGHFVAFQDSGYPAHITALLRKDLVRIFTEAGFSNIVFNFTDSGGIPKAPRILWQTISGGFLKGRWFSDNLIMSATLGTK